MFNLTRQEQAVVIFLIGAIILGGGVLYYRDVVLERVEPEVAETKIQAADDTQIIVDVSGAVWRSGVYTLKAGARVKDVVYKAIPRSDANLEVLNLAAPLRDGQKIVVPVKPGEAAMGKERSRDDTKTSTRSQSRGTRVNLNTATPAELETLPGIGPVRARAIIDYRNQHNGFKNIEELKKVKRIGEVTFRKVKELITVY